MKAGWRGPRYPGEVPTLGWQCLSWATAFLPSPNDDTKPFIFTDEQARIILRMFALDPLTGRGLVRRTELEEPKGWGKSPFAAVYALLGFRGPVCFDGWDADGEPVGVPWGTGDRPAPWVQIGAVSEDQTDNTYSALYGLLTANAHKAAIDLRIDQGRTRLLLLDQPTAKLEPVTAAFGSREGQRVTDAVLDETWLWKPSNGGVKLARTIRRNVAKMGGRTLETTNAPILGEKSVAEQTSEDLPEPGVLHIANRPSVVPQPDWTDERIIAALDEVYGEAHWIDRRRILAEIRDTATDWNDSIRFNFNTRTTGAGAAVDPRIWDALRRSRDVPAKTRIGAGFDGSVSRDATVLRGCTAEGYSFIIESWVRPKGAPASWKVDRASVRAAVDRMFTTWDVGLFLCDPPKWWTEIGDWAETYGDEVVLAHDTNQYSKHARSVDRWLTGIREGHHTHDGDPVTDAHVKAAHLRRVRVESPEDDGRTLYVLVKGAEGAQIDGAEADVLAYEAAMTMPPLVPFLSNYETEGLTFAGPMRSR